MTVFSQKQLFQMKSRFLIQYSSVQIVLCEACHQPRIFKCQAQILLLAQNICCSEHFLRKIWLKFNFHCFVLILRFSLEAGADSYHY